MIPNFNSIYQKLKDEEERKDQAAKSVGEAFGSIFALFLYPFLIMKGWDAIAWHFNLPVFDYWQVFCIANGFRYLFGTFFARRK